MPQEKLSQQEFAQSIKAKYPQYEGVEDSVLVEKILDKYPEYSEKVDFGEKKNLNESTTTSEKIGDGTQPVEQASQQDTPLPSFDESPTPSRAQSDVISDERRNGVDPLKHVTQPQSYEGAVKGAINSFWEKQMPVESQTQQQVGGEAVPERQKELASKVFNEGQTTSGLYINKAESDAVEDFFVSNKEFIGDAKTVEEAYQNIIKNKSKKLSDDEKTWLEQPIVGAEDAPLKIVDKLVSEGKRMEQKQAQVSGEIGEKFKENILSQLPEDKRGDVEFLRDKEKELAKVGVRVDLSGDGKMSSTSDFGSLVNSTVKGLNNLGYTVQYYNPISIIDDIETKRAKLESLRSDDIEHWDKKINTYEKSLTENIENGNISNAFGQVLNITGESIPMMAAAGAATHFGNPYAGYAMISTLSAGETYLNVKNEDWYKEMSDTGKFAYISAVSLAEGGGEMLGGRVMTRMAKQIMEDASSSAAKKTFKEFVSSYAKGMGYNLSEGAVGEIPPAVSEYISTAFAKGEQITGSGLWEATKEGIYGGAGMGGLMTGASQSVGVPLTAINQYKIREYDKNILELKKSYAETSNPYERAVIAKAVSKSIMQKHIFTQKEMDMYNSMSNEDKLRYDAAVVDTELSLNTLTELDKTSDAYQIEKSNLNEAQTRLFELEQKYSNKQVTNQEVTAQPPAQVESDVQKNETFTEREQEKKVNRLDELREELQDRTDDIIAQTILGENVDDFIEERANKTKAIADEKIKLGMDVYDKKREQQVLESAKKRTEELGGDWATVKPVIIKAMDRAKEVQNEHLKEANVSAKTQGFFSDVVSGKNDKYKPSKPYEYEDNFSESQNKFKEDYDSRKGEFDEHIATSIPKFRDTQVKKGQAIVEMYPDGAVLYDLGGSEGGFGKAITSQSGGRIKTINLDPNQDMVDAHNSSPVDGADVVKEAFQEGFDDVKAHKPKVKADVVHESMLFQFINKERKSKIKEVKDNYLKNDGIFITEEKFKLSDKTEEKANESAKDANKKKYYTDEQISAKGDEVLVGMGENQANFDEYLSDLKNEFKYVSTYWTSGNFRGIIATNNKSKFDDFLNKVDDSREVKKDYAAQETDRVKALPKESEDGATMNLDGTKYEKGGLVIPLASKNMKQSELTREAIDEFIEENRGSISSDNVKVGIYKFPNSDQVSIDLNIVADPSMREEALAIGKELGQESLFDLDTFENIKTGADGKNPKKLTPKEFKDIQARLTGKVKTATPQQKVENVIEASNESKLRELISNASESKKAVIRTIINATRATMRVLPSGFKLKLVTNSKDFAKIAGETEDYVKKNSYGGFFDTNENAVYINLDEATPKTVVHEMFHAILLNALSNSNANVRNAAANMIGSLRRSLSRNLSDSISEDIALLESAVREGKYEQSEVNEEVLARLAEEMSQEYNNLKPNIKQYIRNAINKFLEAVGLGKYKIAKAATDQAVIDFFNTIPKMLAKGDVISEEQIDFEPIEINPNAKPTPNEVDNSPIDKKRKSIDIRQDLGLTRHKNINDNMNLNTKLSKFFGKKIHLTFSDRLVTGFINGKEYLGGIFYPAVTGNVWAANSKMSAKKLLNGLNKSKDADGYSYLAVAFLSEDSHMSNKNMSAIAVSLVEDELASGNIPEGEAIKRITKAFNRKPLQKFKKDFDKWSKSGLTFKKIRDLIDETVLSDRATFEERKAFLESVLGKTNVNKSARLGNLPSYTELASDLAEPRSVGHDFGDTFIIVRAKGDLSIATPKEGDKDYHPSYSHAIRASEGVETFVLEKAYNASELFPFIKSKGIGFDDYVKKYGGSAKYRYNQWLGAGKLSTSVTEEMAKQPKTKKKSISVSPKNSANYANMTEDGDGNFVFFHDSREKRSSIRTSSGATRETSRTEAAALGKVGGVAMFYTSPRDTEGFGSYRHVVKVPVEKVYDADSDPNNYYEKGKKLHSKEHKGMGYDGNTQVAYITKLAVEDGFEMVVAAWKKGWSRAQTTLELSPSAVNDTKTTYKDNRDSFQSVPKQSRIQFLAPIYEKISDIFNKNGDYNNRLYSLSKMGYISFGDRFAPFKTQEEITKAIESSKEVPQNLKDEYKAALEMKIEGGKSVPRNNVKKSINTPLEEARKTQTMFSEQENMLYEESRKKRNWIANLKNKWTDRQSNIRKALVDANAKLAEAIMTTKAGATVMADRHFKKVEKKIYGDLTLAEEKILDMIMFHERVIQIDENFDSKSDSKQYEALYWESEADAIEHIDPNKAKKLRAKAAKLMDSVKSRPKHPRGFNKESSEAALEGLREEFGAETYDKVYERAQMVFNEFNGIMERMYKYGLVTEETYDRFKEDKYIPRQFLHHLFAKEIVNSKDGSGLRATQIKAIEEGSEELAMMDSRILLNSALRSVENRRFQNDANSALAKTLAEHGESNWLREANYEYDRKTGEPKVDSFGNKVIKEADKGFVNVNFFKDGLRDSFQMEGSLYNEWMDLNRDIDPEWSNFVRTIMLTGILKKFATGQNPAFFISNVPIDYTNVLLFTDIYDENALLVKSAVDLGVRFSRMAKGVAALKGRELIGLKESEKAYTKKLFDEAVEHGLMMEFLTTYGKPDEMFARDKAKVQGKPRKAWNTTKTKTVDGLAFTGEVSEIAMRLAVYEKVRKKMIKESGKKESVLSKEEMDEIAYTAAAKARKTIDFAQGGNFSKKADLFIPYFNAALQGFRVAGSYAAKNPTKFASKMAQMAVPVAAIVLSNMAIADDDDWEQVSDFDKNMYFIIFLPTKDKDGNRQFIKIRKHPQAAPFLNLIEWGVMKGFDKKMGKNWAANEDIAKRTLEGINDALPAPIPLKIENGEMSLDLLTVLAKTPPALQAATTYAANFDFFRGEEITREKDEVPISEEGLYDKYIPTFYKEFGERMNMSPARTKAAVEKIITNPSTNAVVGLSYSLMDNLVTMSVDDDKYKKIPSNYMGVDGMGHAITRKVLKSTNPYIQDGKTKQQVEDIKLEEKSKDNKIKNDIRYIFDKNKDSKTSFQKDVKEYIKENVDVQDRLRMVDYAKTMWKTKDLKKTMPMYYKYMDIKYERDPEVQGEMLALYIGYKEVGDQDLKQAIRDMKSLDISISDRMIAAYKKAIKDKKK